jgi:hypothetical protein
MARGNNGNLLQHAVECEVVRSALADFANKNALHLFTTHSMRPFEDLEAKKGSSETKLFNMWLDAAIGADHNIRRVDTSSFPAILDGYRGTSATYVHYPNTAELAASFVERARISGVLCEADPQLFNDLSNRWHGSKVRVRSGDWRSNVSSLTAFEILAPWLFSLDPMSYSIAPHGASLSNDFHESDFELINPIVDGLLKSVHPGAMCLFCYSLVKEDEERFRSACSTFSKQFDIEPLFFAIRGKRFFRDYKHHLSFVLSNSSHIRSTLSKQWERVVVGPQKCLEESFNPTK